MSELGDRDWLAWRSQSALGSSPALLSKKMRTEPGMYQAPGTMSVISKVYMRYETLTRRRQYLKGNSDTKIPKNAPVFYKR